jgi:BirA family biotin operon repressor/biotin-[acetyl-CoA-carboxylase] ligase
MLKKTELNREVLALLENGERNDFVSGAEISKSLGITRAAVWKRIKKLQRSGYIFEAAPSKGYKLIKCPDVPTREAIRTVFHGELIGRDILFYEVTTSTNDKALEIGVNGQEGTVVVADAQDCGRGRFGRQWISPPGSNLYFTVLLKPPLSPRESSLITLMAAVAVASGIREYTGIHAEIKWPNDILVRGRKVGGILTEMKSDMDRVEVVVVGIGINVNMAMNILPRDVRSLSTALIREKGQPVNRIKLLGIILANLEHWYRRVLNGEKDALLKAWQSLDVTIGETVNVKMYNRVLTGRAEGISDDGELMVRCAPDIVEKVYAGEVTLVKNANMKG